MNMIVHKAFSDLFLMIIIVISIHAGGLPFKNFKFCWQVGSGTQIK